MQLVPYWYQVSDTRYQVLVTRYQVSGIMYQLVLCCSDCRGAVPAMRYHTRDTEEESDRYRAYGKHVHHVESYLYRRKERS